MDIEGAAEEEKTFGGDEGSGIVGECTGVAEGAGETGCAGEGTGVMSTEGASTGECGDRDASVIVPGFDSPLDKKL
jgi:hypothetical protein